MNKRDIYVGAVCTVVAAAESYFFLGDVPSALSLIVLPIAASADEVGKKIFLETEASAGIYTPSIVSGLLAATASAAVTRKPVIAIKYGLLVASAYGIAEQFLFLALGPETSVENRLSSPPS